MYDLPEIARENDRFWALIRAELGHGPEALTRSDDLWSVWENPDLLFAQTCGYPFRARLHSKVQFVGAPDYGAPGCPPGYYRTVFVARRTDARQDLSSFDGARFAYNEAMSQSGWAAPIQHLLEANLRPGGLVETGGHALSAQAAADGRADFAGLDIVTWTLLQEHRPELTSHLKAIAYTKPTPALPYITALQNDAASLFEAVSRAISRLPDATRDALHLKGLVAIPVETYLAVPTPPGPGAL